MRKLEDAYLHKGLRKQLVELLRTKGITDEQVLEAIGSIPRHFFLDSAFDRIAYEDRAFPIAADQLFIKTCYLGGAKILRLNFIEDKR
jgi:protein-L-isoaspartate(D-aspartate) O-methyltransferase